MKKHVLIIILFSVYFEATAQHKVIDTTWFRVQKANVADTGLFDAFDSIILAFSQGYKSIQKKVWYISYIDEDIDSNLMNTVALRMFPSDFILPVMKKSRGFFYYKDNLFFIEKGNGKDKKHCHIFEYSNKTKSFYYITINWRLFWASDMKEAEKKRLTDKYGLISDDPTILLTRDTDGLWTWHRYPF